MKAGPAIRVAAVATMLIACVYAVAAAAIFAMASARLPARPTPAWATRSPAPGTTRESSSSTRTRADDSDGDNDDRASPSLPLDRRGGAAAAAWLPRSRPRPRPCPPACWGPGRPGRAVTADLGTAGPYRLITELSRPADDGGPEPAGRHAHRASAAGQRARGRPAAPAGHVRRSLIVGMRALAPVEPARRRQLEFTADASHELVLR